jgi:predicted methyltransferase
MEVLDHSNCFKYEADKEFLRLIIQNIIYHNHSSTAIKAQYMDKPVALILPVIKLLRDPGILGLNMHLPALLITEDGDSLCRHLEMSPS